MAKVDSWGKPMQLMGPDGNIVDTEATNGCTGLTIVKRNPEAYISCFSISNVSAETAYMLIDLSSAGGFKHPENADHIHIYAAHVQINPDNTYVGNVKVGFLSNVDATNGDFNQFYEWHVDRASLPIVHGYIMSSHFEQTSWIGLTTADSTLFQTDVNLVGPDGGNYPSGNGDFVLWITRTAGAVDVSIALEYGVDCTN